MKLTPYRSQQQALPDLLNWAALIEPDILLNKDGSLTAAAYYQGSDLATASTGERNQICGVLNAALSLLGSGWLMHVEAIRLPARDYPTLADSHFPDPVTRLIEQERREQFTGQSYFVTAYVLYLTWLPPKLAQNKAIDFLVFEGNTQLGNHQEQLVQQFEQSVQGFFERVGSVLDVYRLEDEELLSALHRSLTGLHHPIRLPSIPMYLDGVIGAHECWTGFNPKIGDHYIQTVSIAGFPADSYPQILAGLDALPFPYRWSTRFLFLDAVEAQNTMKGFRRKWSQQVRGLFAQMFRTSGGTVNLDALAMVEATDHALAEASSGQVRFGYYTATVVVMAEDAQQAEQQARAVRQMINDRGFSAHIETINTLEAFLGTLPAHGVQNLRRPMIHTFNLAHLLPLSSVWPGSEVAPCPFYPANSPPLLFAATEGSTPFRLNLHVGDLGHTLMIGPTGSGKSTALGLLAAQFRRYQDARIFAFDKGKSLLPLTLGVGGQHFNVTGSSEDELCFAPLSNLVKPDWFGLLEDWCSTLFELAGLKLTPKQRNELHRALMALREGQADRTLTNLQVTLQDSAMKEALQAYTLDGELGLLLDSAEDGLSLSHWACFEIEELMHRSDRVKLPVLLYLFAVIEKSLQGRPTLLILDEAWLMLGHDVFRQKLREWLKVLRKANCAVIVATQSLSDAAHSGILDVLTESCPTKIFLANADAQSEINAPLYQSMGITQAEMAAIAQMRPKREYFIKGEGKRIIDFHLGDIALAFLGHSDKESLARIKQLWDNNNDEFIYYWMQELGVNYECFVEQD